MKSKKLMNAHLALMAVLAVFNLLAAATMLLPASRPAFSIPRVMMYVCQFLALCAGIVHLRSEYGKEASGYYKAFLLLVFLSYCLGNFSQIAVSGWDVRAVIRLISMAALIVLALKKDLGKKNSWIVYSALLISEIAITVILGISYMPNAGLIGYIFYYSGVLGRLLCVGAIGLSLRGKYADKDERGTK